MFRAVRGPLVLIVLIASSLLVLWLLARSSLPTHTGSLVLPGLAAAVEIERDVHGIPHIRAGSQEDLFYALGFVHAQDRLWQLEYSRQKALGRLAEWLGEEAVASDSLMRTLALARAAERDLAGLSPRGAGMLAAYCDGINAFLETRSGALPPEFSLLGVTPRAWQPADVLTLLKAHSWERAAPGLGRELLLARIAVAVDGDGLSSLLDEDTPLPASRAIYEELPLAELQERLGRVVRPVAPSRAWAASGANTASGAPLLAVELAGLASAPAPLYLVALEAPGLVVAGATLPGIPALLAGRNERLAWAVLPADLDTLDLVIERVSASRQEADAGGEEGSEGTGGAGRYRVPGGWREFDSRQETLIVRGSEDVILTVRESRHGPVLTDLLSGEGAGPSDYVLALSWSALLEGDRSLEAAMGIPYAGDVDELRGTLGGLHGLGGRVWFATSEDRLGWQTVGRSPQRRSGDGSIPVPGWTDRFAWVATVPLADLPGRADPEDGILTGEGGGGEGPLEAVLATLGSHTAESFRASLALSVDRLAPYFLPTLQAALPHSPLARRAHAQLLGWQGEARANSAAPELFRAWYRAFAGALLIDDLGEELAGLAAEYPLLIAGALPARGASAGAGSLSESRPAGASEPDWCDDGRTERLESCLEIASLALEVAVAQLAANWGRDVDAWPQREAGQAHYRHPVYGRSLLAGLFNVRIESRRPAAHAAAARDYPDRSEEAAVYRAVFELAAETPPARDASGESPSRAEGDAAGRAGGEGPPEPLAAQVGEAADWTGSGHLLPTGQSGNPLSEQYRGLAEEWAAFRLVPLLPGRQADGSSQLLTLEPRR